MDEFEYARDAVEALRSTDVYRATLARLEANLDMLCKDAPKDDFINFLLKEIYRMQVKVFAIYDSKAEAYLTPFFMKSVGEAIRALTTHANDSEHNFFKYAEDFTLFELGVWNDSTGKFELLNAPHSVTTFIELKKPLKQFFDNKFENGEVPR